MTIAAEFLLVTSSIAISMLLSRLALGQVFVLVRMDNRLRPTPSAVQTSL